MCKRASISIFALVPPLLARDSVAFSLSTQMPQHYPTQRITLTSMLYVSTIQLLLKRKFDAQLPLLLSYDFDLHVTHTGCVHESAYELSTRAFIFGLTSENSTFFNHQLLAFLDSNVNMRSSIIRSESVWIPCGLYAKALISQVKQRASQTHHTQVLLSFLNHTSFFAGTYNECAFIVNF